MRPWIYSNSATTENSLKSHTSLVFAIKETVNIVKKDFQA